MTRYTDIVIGSGPSGLAAALGIIDAGRRPVVVDFGPNNPDLRRKIGPSSQDLARKSSDVTGDPFSYPQSLIVHGGLGALPLSSARGGLSTIWGAGILARNSDDLHGMESIQDGILEAYQALFMKFSVAGAADRLSNRFPWPSISDSVPSSVRFAGIRVAAETLSSDNVLAGSPRVAMNSLGCTRCGLCLKGCPENLFLSTDIEINKLAQQNLCDIINGPVLKLTKFNNLITVTTTSGDIQAERVYVAAGPIATPALLQRSGLASAQLFAEDAAVFYVAIQNFNKANGDEEDFTASQLLVTSATSGPDDFALSVYESNHEYQERLARVLRLPQSLVPYPKFLRCRLNAGIGFLPPIKSGVIEFKYSAGRTWVRRHKNAMTREAAKSAVRRTAAALREVGLRPVASSVMVPPVGSSYHVGSSMKMGGKDTGWFGELHIAQDIRIVDASSIPQLWPGSHTFTVMANAYRIGRLS